METKANASSFTSSVSFTVKSPLSPFFGPASISASSFLLSGSSVENILACTVLSMYGII